MGVENLVFLGQVVGEVATVAVGLVANGSNVFADLLYLPKAIKAGEDAVAAISAYQADLAEVKTLDEAGRQTVAAAWKAAMPSLGDKSVDDAIAVGLTTITYVLEALKYLLGSQAATK